MKKIRELLDSGLKVLIYNGQDDMVVNPAGAMTWIDNMNWKGKDTFSNLDFEVWRKDGEVVGYKKQYGNLRFQMVNKAGHFVPFEQLENSLIMAKEFINESLEVPNHIAQ